MSSAKSNNKFFIHLIIMFVIMIGFRFLPVVSEMTPGGMQVAGIFIAVVYGWVFIGLLLPSILGIIMAGLTELTTTTEFLAAGFGSQTFLMVVGILIITAFIAQSNLFQLIAQTMLSLKFAKGKPWVTLLCFLYANYAVATVMSSLGAALLFVPLYKQIAETVGLQKNSRLNNVMITGIAFASLMGDITFPFQITVIMVPGTLTAATGIAVNLGRYILAVLPWAIFMLAVYVAICKFILRVDATPIANMNLDELNFDKQKATKRQKVSLCFILFTIILLVLPNFLPKAWSLTQILTTLGMGGSFLVVIFIMSVVHVDGSPLLNIRTIAKDISWDMIFMMAYFAPIASLLTSDATGIKATVSSVLQPFLADLSPILLIIAIGVVAVALTNILNNLVVAVMLTSMISILSDFLVGVNMVALMTFVIFCCEIAYILPSACPTNAFLYSQRDLIDFKGQFSHAIVVGIIMLVLALTLGLSWFNLVF